MPLRVSAFQSVAGDLYARGSDNQSVWPPLRSLVEFDPEVLYLRPTADRPTLTLLQAERQLLEYRIGLYRGLAGSLPLERPAPAAKSPPHPHDEEPSL